MTCGHFNIVHTVQCVPSYPYIYQLSCFTLCFFTDILDLAAMLFGLY